MLMLKLMLPRFTLTLSYAYAYVNAYRRAQPSAAPFTPGRFFCDQILHLRSCSQAVYSEIRNFHWKKSCWPEVIHFLKSNLGLKPKTNGLGKNYVFFLFLS